MAQILVIDMAAAKAPNLALAHTRALPSPADPRIGEVLELLRRQGPVEKPEAPATLALANDAGQLERRARLVISARRAHQRRRVASRRTRQRPT
ncbi:MAG: hypothetical protein ACPG4T_17300 [Nannocystaceae bacterium]